MWSYRQPVIGKDFQEKMGGESSLNGPCEISRDLSSELRGEETVGRGSPQLRFRTSSLMRLESHPAMKEFEIANKSETLESLEKWRKLSLVLNASRRFRYVADTKKRRQAEDDLNFKRTFKIAGMTAQATRRFVDALQNGAQTFFHLVQGKARKYGFEIDSAQLTRLMQGDTALLLQLGGVSCLADKLKTSIKEGISDEETDIIARREVFGFNTYPEKPPKGFWVFVWEALHDLTLMILTVCALVSLVIGIFADGWREGWYDGGGIAFSIILVVFVTAASDYQQALQFQDLDREKKKIFIEVTRKNRRQKISIFDLVVGDLVHLGIGDQVPADGVLISAMSLLVDEACMTGESEMLHKDEEQPFLLSGTKVQDGCGLMLVTGVGMNTEWGHLMATLGESGTEETPLQVKLSGVATLVGKVGVLFAAVTFTVLLGRYLLMKESLLHWSAEDGRFIVNFFVIAVTIVVVAVPEGLPLAVTLTLAFAMKKMMADKALVRHLAACETMGSATIICSDKTGTLTTNKMTVVRSWVGGAVRDAYEVKVELPNEFLQILFEGTFQNTSGSVEENENGMPPSLLGSPTETAVLRFGLALGGNFRSFCAKSEVLKMEPFNSARKRMGIIVRDQRGNVRAHWKGAAELISKLCNRYVDIDGNVAPIEDSKRLELNTVIETFASAALRTLCLAYKEIEDIPGPNDSIPDQGFILSTILGIKDPLRTGVKEAVRLCGVAGIKVRMITGDNIATAKAIARECGILTDGGIAMEGPDFRKLSPPEMWKRIPTLQVMARSSPADKHTLVRELRAMGEVVAVTGDGTNDAPALREADIGLAMGIAGTEVAKECADVVILDDNFASIVNVAKWGRSVYTNIQKFVQFQLTVNLVALVINFTSACITGTVPLTAVQLLWVNLIMDTLGALALATEPPYDELMERPPTSRYSDFINNVMWRNIIVQVLYQLTVLTVLQYMGKEILTLKGPDADEVLNTMIFNTFVFCQVFNELNAREMYKVNVFRHLFNNWIFFLILLITVTFQFMLVEFLGKFANTVPLSKEHWFITVSIGFISMFIAAIGKLIPTPTTPIFGKGTKPFAELEQIDGYLRLPAERNSDRQV